MPEDKPPYRRWVGVLLSFLIPGAGPFLAGHRRAGVRWFVLLGLLSLLTSVAAPLPFLPGVWVPLGLAGLSLALWLAMLARSYVSVPRLGWKRWGMILGLALAIQVVDYALATPFVRMFNVPTGSMTPTVTKEDHVMAQPCAYWFREPRRGDLVVFSTRGIAHPHVPQDQFYLKRVVGLPGETLGLRNRHLTVNGSIVSDSPEVASMELTQSLAAGGRLAEGVDCVVPRDSVFVIGDNTQNSLDSRFFGAVPLSNLRGRVTKIYWPPARAGDVR